MVGRPKRKRKVLCASLGTSLAACAEMFAAWAGYALPPGGGAALGGCLALVCTYINTED